MTLLKPIQSIQYLGKGIFLYLLTDFILKIKHLICNNFKSIVKLQQYYVCLCCPSIWLVPESSISIPTPMQRCYIRKMVTLSMVSVKHAQSRTSQATPLSFCFILQLLLLHQHVRIHMCTHMLTHTYSHTHTYAHRVAMVTYSGRCQRANFMGPIQS